MTELDKFREEWKREIAERKTTVDRATGDAEVPESVKGNNQKALELYEKAVILEASSQMSDAVKFYREAFKLDERVDKLYASKLKLQEPQGDAKNTTKTANASSLTARSDSSDSSGSRISKHGSLSIDPTTRLEPEDESLPFAFGSVPDDVLIIILTMLGISDPLALTNFAECCMKLYSLFKSKEVIWKSVCDDIYHRQLYVPAIDEDEITKTYEYLYSKMFLSRPRVRFNGVYISKCSYIHQGQSEDGWNQPFRMLVYYRYLRFYEDGGCLSLLTPATPPEIAPFFDRDCKERVELRQHERRGNWHLNNEGDEAILNIALSGSGTIKHRTFHMQLNIRSSGRRKLNKLKWCRYWSENSRTEETEDYDMSTERSYYFYPCTHRIFERVDPQAEMLAKMEALRT